MAQTHVVICSRSACAARGICLMYIVSWLMTCEVHLKMLHLTCYHQQVCKGICSFPLCVYSSTKEDVQQSRQHWLQGLLTSVTSALLLPACMLAFIQNLLASSLYEVPMARYPPPPITCPSHPVCDIVSVPTHLGLGRDAEIIHEPESSLTAVLFPFITSPVHCAQKSCMCFIAHDLQTVFRATVADATCSLTVCQRKLDSEHPAAGVICSTCKHCLLI